MTRQKRALAVHDLSGVGRCSLTVALPVLSAAGVECSCLPTAILSTHTGGFTGYTYRDLTADMLPMAEHWQRLGLRFDALYTGYLGSAEQIGTVQRLMDMFAAPDTLRLVDPVMADHGSLYVGFAEDFPQKMRALCERADVIIPNMTEAALLLGERYREGPYEPAYVEGLLLRLAELGPKTVVVTGVRFDDKMLGAGCLSDGRVSYALAERVPGAYHGTGDVWGSAFLAALLRGTAVERACQIACDFTTDCAARTLADGTDLRYGVRFEAALPGFMKALGAL